jgi:hypothetical protein
MSDASMFPEDSHPELDRLLTRYREACGSPEPGPNFMPLLWQKIESRQSKGFVFERVARIFVVTALAACCFLGVFLALPGQQPSVFYSGTFVEALASAHTSETFPSIAPILEPVHLDLAQDQVQ